MSLATLFMDEDIIGRTKNRQRLIMGMQKAVFHRGHLGRLFKERVKRFWLEKPR